LIDSARTLLHQKRAHLVIVKSRSRDLATIGAWVEAGKLRAVVHGVYTLDQAVEAQQQIESKHTRGKVVIRV
jgi:NADPH:quinone reductase-like Zn-dependent oxidoreductase